MECYVDTSAFYAYLVAADRHQEPVRQFLGDALHRGARLFSSSFVLCETLGLLDRRHGRAGAAAFLDDVFPVVEWRWVDEVLFEAIRLIHARRRRRGFTIVDASAVACIAERPGSLCVAIDDGLRGLGFEVHPAG